MAVKEWVEFFLVFNQYLERAGPSIWWFWKVMNAYNEEYDVITMKNNFCFLLKIFVTKLNSILSE